MLACIQVQIAAEPGHQLLISVNRNRYFVGQKYPSAIRQLLCIARAPTWRAQANKQPKRESKGGGIRTCFHNNCTYKPRLLLAGKGEGRGEGGGPYHIPAWHVRRGPRVSARRNPRGLPPAPRGQGTAPARRKKRSNDGTHQQGAHSPLPFSAVQLPTSSPRPPASNTPLFTRFDFPSSLLPLPSLAPPASSPPPSPSFLNLLPPSSALTVGNKPHVLGPPSLTKFEGFLNPFEQRRFCEFDCQIEGWVWWGLTRVCSPKLSASFVEGVFLCERVRLGDAAAVGVPLIGKRRRSWYS